MVLHNVPRFQNSIKVVRIFPADWVRIGLVKPADSPVRAVTVPWMYSAFPRCSRAAVLHRATCEDRSTGVLCRLLTGCGHGRGLLATGLRSYCCTSFQFSVQVGGFHCCLLVAHAHWNQHITNILVLCLRYNKSAASPNKVIFLTDAEVVNGFAIECSNQHPVTPPSSSLATLLPAFAAAASSAASFHRNPVSTLAVRLSPL